MLHNRIFKSLLNINTTTTAANKLKSNTFSTSSIPLKSSKLSLYFNTINKPGSLQNILNIFYNNNINLTFIQSRPSKILGSYDFFIDFDGDLNNNNVILLLNNIKSTCSNFTIVEPKKVPWFPKKIEDLDKIGKNVLSAGSDLEADHPGFCDESYRKRRQQITDVAMKHRIGAVIPEINYCKEEHEAWSLVWKNLMPLHKKHACDEFLEAFELIQKNCDFNENKIPAFEPISQFLKSRTGFVLNPVAGLLSGRDFLNALAFRVFFSTQYIRHPSKPLYTPEPDVVHEVLGHVPLFANPDFADFSQEIGLASIGASDEQLIKLLRCYWYSVEFGLCRQGGDIKAYGAGLLSSIGELEYSIASPEPKRLDWDPVDAGLRDYPITKYQPTYYVADSFADAKKKLRQYSDLMEKPFHVRMSANGHTLEVDRNIEMIGDSPCKPTSKSV